MKESSVDPRRSHLGFVLGEAAWAVHNAVAIALAPFDLTPQIFGALLLVDATNPSQTRLGERLRMDRTSVTKLIDRLESDGWVRRQADPQDRRSHRLTLNDDIRDRFERAQAAVGAAEQAAVAATGTEISDLRKLLATLLRD